MSSDSDSTTPTSDTLKAIELALRDLQLRVQDIEMRNERVSGDKAWETCWARRGLITAMTYFVCSAVLFAIESTAPLKSAFIPAVGYLLSTFSLGWLKKRWGSDK